MGAPVLQTTNVGFPAQFASKIANLYPNQQGDNVSVTCVGGETLIAIAFGLKDYDPFDLIHGSTTAPGFILGINDYNANPTITDNSGDSVAVTSVTETTAALTLTQAAISFVLTSVANAVSTSTTYTGTITGGANNVYAGLSFTITGFTTPANNGTFVCTASTTTTLVLTSSVGVSETHAAVAALPTTSVAYIGTITGGAANALIGYNFQIAGFVNVGNNGYFLATASSVTTLVLTNSGGVNETHAGTATNNVVALTTASNNFNVGDTVTLSGFVTQTWLNGQTQAVVTAGSVFTTNDSAKHASSGPTAQTTAFAARTSGNDWVLAANLNQFGSDYTVSSTPPVAPNPYPSVKWSLDGYMPSMYIWVANNVSAGTYNINLNSMFTTGSAPQWQYGRPIFDGGVNFQVIKFTGMTAASADGNSVSTSSSTANPAVGPAIVTTGTGDLVLAIALQKSANGLNVGPNDGTLSTQYSRITNGKLVGSEAHYMTEWGIQTSSGSWTPKFANPLGYETLIAAIAIKHS